MNEDRSDVFEIDGQTTLVGVMGWPVAHSLSPAMHNAAVRRLGLNWRYLPLAVHPDRLAEAVAGAAALGFRGFNVTVPHKQAVLDHLDVIAPGAAAVGAVNTVVVDRSARGLKLKGHNTDVPGFLDALREGGFEPAGGGKAVVVGAGGASRAVVYGLATAGMDRIVILNRTGARAEQLASDLREVVVGRGALRASSLDPETLLVEASDADLLVNATTVGMWPESEASVWPANAPFPEQLTVYDLVYNPLETCLLRQARRFGARAIDGLGMLARQGALALAKWLDGALDVDDVAAEMRHACVQRLRGRRLGTACDEDGMVE